MKKMCFVAMLLFVSVASFAQKLPADKIIGIWQREDYRIEIFKSGDTYSGRLLWAKDMFEADGKTPKKDSQNPDIKLRRRSRQGIIHITGLKYANGEYVDAQLYNVQDGNTYGLKALLKDADNLELRAYKGVPTLGRTVKWTRASSR